MKERALFYHAQGYNCSQCIIKAAESYFNISVHEQCYNMCAAVNTGFGLGLFCGMLVAGTMVFCLIFDEATAKKLRIQFLSEFDCRHKCFDCAKLKREQRQNKDCEELIGDTAELIQTLIEAEKLL